MLHSEYNASATEPVHFLQNWLLPDRRGIAPSYDQKTFAPEQPPNEWRLVVSPDGADGSLTLHQDARMYVAKVASRRSVT
jgi:quercetin 2,3-dioxygenase